METVASPCIGVCTIDQKTGLCCGCFRSSDEIASWLYYRSDEKKAVLAQLEQRKNNVICVPYDDD